MKVVIINKSDSTGGAAVVSFRLMNALRRLGIDARMLVTEKRSDSPFVECAASPSSIKRAFLAERLKIFLANGMNRDDLFKVDTASDGLPLYRHKLVKEADVICLNWVNQGFLSMKGLQKILKLGKPVVWTMHDMWNFTGICHHAGQCTRWLTNCGLCRFLGKNASPDDLSFSVWNNKQSVYQLGMKLSNSSGTRLHFIAVSNWLEQLARKSPLLAEAPLSVIPNAFPIGSEQISDFNESDNAKNTDSIEKNGKKFTIVMGAARLDDPVKGLPILVEATKVLQTKYPDEASNIELVTFGNIKNPDSIDNIAIKHRHLGLISGEENIRNVYRQCDAVISTSLYETLPGTLVEGQVYGCIPVSFGRGGQSDIVDHLDTGYIAQWDDDIHAAAEHIADGIIWAKQQDKEEICRRMLESARSRFDAPVIARKYLDLFHSLLS